ncbi:MAG TPA: choice-of-anchor D domain-containing protein [Candidatus Acidoferrales bacterium]|nr:choice-of-anchor D domain-containing protein [Candidatus Acidoferrales bacterium]
MRFLARTRYRTNSSSIPSRGTGRAGILFHSTVLLISLVLLAAPTMAGIANGNLPSVGTAPGLPTNNYPSDPGQAGANGTSHYVYIVENGQLQVFDMDNGHSLVKTVSLPGVSSPLGLAVSAATDMLYISYGGFGGSQGNGSVLEYNLLNDSIVWQKNYSHGVDSISVSPDGKTLYVPDGENSGDTLVYVVDAATGNELSTIATGNSPHNAMIGLDGKKLYVGPRNENNLYVVDTATNQVILKVGPLVATNIVSGNGVRPFAINGLQTLAFTTASGFLGFQVGDLATGNVLYTVTPTGFNWNGTGPSAPCHGISLSPDEKELYLLDSVNQVVHVYDITGLPATAPQLVASIQMGAAFGSVGWLQHSRDGRFVQVSDSGDVIDTVTRTTTNTLPISSALMLSRWYIEVDFTNGAPSFGTFERGGPGYVTTLPAPAVSLSSSSVTFASQFLNATSAPQTVTLTNTGNAVLNITSVAVAGTNSGDFSQTNNCGSSVAAIGGNCSINVTFTPTATGTRTASVIVTDDAAGSPHTITLSGSGAAPIVGLSSSSLAFANQTLNTTSAAQTVTLTNTGNAVLNITSVGVTGANSGDFAQTNTCGSSVAANNGNCTISVTFAPTATGVRTAAVTVIDDAAGSPHSINLSGTGAGIPAVTFSSAGLTFASQTLNTASAAQTVTLSNTGSGALNITSIGVTGTNSGDFAQTNNCGSSVAANGGNCNINVTFTPTATGTRTASVTITDDAAGSPHTIALSGTGAVPPAPIVSLSSSSLAFANQTLNTTSAAQTVTLTNTGNAALNIISIGVTGANSGDFAQTNNCGSSVAANNGNCTINVTFTPTATGARAAAVTITDNATGSPHTITLSGTGAGAPAPGVSFSAQGLTYASQTLNTTSAAQTVTLTNTGNAALSIGSLGITGANSGDFAQTNNCGSSVAANNGNCTINVTFTPTAAGARGASVTITDNAAGSPHSFTLSGTGTTTPAPTASLSASSLTFAGQTLNTTSGSQSVTLTNTGNAALTITSIGVTGANSGDFAQTNNCGSSVGANNGNCTINVTFTPTAAGARGAAVTITDNAAGSPQTVSLTGTGLAPGTPGANLSPASLTFASQTISSTSAAQTVTLSNSGSATLTITGIAASGDFGQSNNCGSSLAAGGNCSISVTFTPTAAGTRTGTLSVTDNASGSPQSVTLTGTGANSTADFSLTATAITGTVTAGQPATFSLTVTPSGGFNQAVNLTCSGAPQGAACIISPSSVTPSGSGPMTTTIMVTTTANAMVGPQLREFFPTSRGQMELMMLALLMAMLAMLTTVAAIARKREQTRLVLAFAMVMVLLGSGCLGGAKNSPPVFSGTPAGTYTLTVMGASGTGSNALVHTVKVTLVVN